MGIDVCQKKQELINALDKKKERLKSLRKQLEEAIEKQQEFEMEKLEISINSLLWLISNLEGRIANLRDVIDDDKIEREKIRRDFAQQVDEIIPDKTPIVFHGNNNISMVETIMKSGGLFTPEERGVKTKSLATKIDVTYKNNIKTSLEWAETGLHYIDPYGAIFVFIPNEDEYEEVINTVDSQVLEGVNSINFKKEPERLVAIITTSENIERLKRVANDNGIDPEKIMTHEEFLTFCKEKYKGFSR